MAVHVALDILCDNVLQKLTLTLAD